MGREAADAPDRVAGAQQVLAEMRTDEPGGAGDECEHSRSLASDGGER
jgi:hypothetical protein